MTSNYYKKAAPLTKKPDQFAYSSSASKTIKRSSEYVVRTNENPVSQQCLSAAKTSPSTADEFSHGVVTNCYESDEACELQADMKLGQDQEEIRQRTRASSDNIQGNGSS